MMRNAGRSAALAALLGLVGCGGSMTIPEPSPDDWEPAPGGADLVADGNWQTFPGASLDGDTLVIRDIDRHIVAIDDEVIAAEGRRLRNPPIHLRGPLLEVGGDLRLRATIDSARTGTVTLTIYPSLPLVFDEWLQHGRAIEISLTSGGTAITFWDGFSASHLTIVDPGTAGQQGPIELAFRRENGALALDVAGREVISISDPGIFPDGRAWLGAAAYGDTLRIRGLRAERHPGDTATHVDRDDPAVAVPTAIDSLRALASHAGIRIGSCVAPYPLAADPTYRAVVGREFDTLTPENAMKWQFVHPAPTEYAFAEPDLLVDYAEANAMRIHGHTLVWSEALPDWVALSEHTDKELRAILHDHIATLVGRYRGRVATWDVLNEPIEDEGGVLRDTLWRRALGVDYPDAAFRWAHEADPDAQLFINEYSVDDINEKSDALLALVQAMRARGTPVAGVGLQFHEDLGDPSTPSRAAIIANLERFRAADIAVRISELDMDIPHDPTPADLRAQGAFFATVLDACLTTQACATFATWGITDRYSSLHAIPDYDAFGAGLLYDIDYQKKPAYTAIWNRLAPPR